MKSYDIIAWVLEGAIFCEDCKPQGDEPSPWFAEHESDLIGSTCDSCKAWYSPDDGWTQADCHKDYRWSTCAHCNSQKPWAISDRDYKERRAESIFNGGFRCEDCYRNTARFDISYTERERRARAKWLRELPGF